MRYPKEMEIWQYSPGRRLAEVVVKVKNVKGALATCSQAISDFGVNMLSGVVTAPSTTPVATWSFFVDITDARGDMAEFKSRIMSVDIVESVEVLVSEDGFMVDKQHFPVHWAGRRAVVMRADALSEMLYRLWNVFGSGAATIVDQMAEAMGRHWAKEVIQDFSQDFATKKFDELLGSYSALGYGEVSVERPKSSEFPFVLHTRSLFECEANAKRRLHQKSVFFKAHLRGFVSGVFGSSIEVTEVQCLTEGDEVCSFRIAVSESPAQPVFSRTPEKPLKSLSQSNF